MEEYEGWVMGNFWGYGHKREFEIQAIKQREGMFRLQWKGSDWIEESYDDNIIACLNIDLNVFHKKLREFGGVKHPKFNFTFFRNRTKARKAAAWINSIIVANKLMGEY